MEIITILNLKGGVAKTTTALNIAQALRELGYKTLMIDLDYQKSLSILALQNKKITALELLKSNNPEAIIKEALTGDIITAHEDLLTLDSIDPLTLKRILELKEIKNIYDYIVIDNHCIFNALTLNSLMASNKLIIPTTATKLGYIGVEDMTSLLNLIKKVYKKNLEAYILFTDFKPKTELNSQYKELLEALAKETNLNILNTFIRHSQPIEDSQALGLNLFEYSKRSNGAKDYLEATKEIFKI